MGERTRKKENRMKNLNNHENSLYSFSFPGAALLRLIVVILCPFWYNAFVVFVLFFYFILFYEIFEWNQQERKKIVKKSIFTKHSLTFEFVFFSVALFFSFCWLMEFFDKLENFCNNETNFVLIRNYLSDLFSYS